MRLFNDLILIVTLVSLSGTFVPSLVFADDPFTETVLGSDVAFYRDNVDRLSECISSAIVNEFAHRVAEHLHEDRNFKLPEILEGELFNVVEEDGFRILEVARDRFYFGIHDLCIVPLAPEIDIGGIAVIEDTKAVADKLIVLVRNGFPTFAKTFGIHDSVEVDPNEECALQKARYSNIERSRRAAERHNISARLAIQAIEHQLRDSDGRSRRNTVSLIKSLSNAIKYLHAVLNLRMTQGTLINLQAVDAHYEKVRALEERLATIVVEVNRTAVRRNELTQRADEALADYENCVGAI